MYITDVTVMVVIGYYNIDFIHAFYTALIQEFGNEDLNFFYLYLFSFVFPFLLQINHVTYPSTISLPSRLYEDSLPPKLFVKLCQ